MRFLIPILVAITSISITLAAQTTVPLAPGDSLTYTCPSTAAVNAVDKGNGVVTCATLFPTAAPTATLVPTATSVPAPAAGSECPTWVHDRYTTTGADGKQYPTWHPPVDPQYGCLFGHEHGADPRTSKANPSMPAFGYAAAQMGMTEPHTGFKVFVLNAGETVESSSPNKIATLDSRLVFHMGTSGVGRYSQEFHSLQFDEIYRDGSGLEAHVIGMGDTGPTEKDGSTCDSPRQGAKDFSTLGCADTYEIWNAVRFQIIDPHDTYTGVDQSRFGMVPSIAVFDPITTRDSSNPSALIYTESQINPVTHYKQPWWGYAPVPDPTSPQAYYQGCRREFYTGPSFWKNSVATTYWTDVFGNVSQTNSPDSSHSLRQDISLSQGAGAAIKFRQDFCGNNIHSPN